MNFKRRNEKGITLVALVVTIIVLIILAGVSINLLVGQDGLISRAKLAKEQYEMRFPPQDLDETDDEIDFLDEEQIE